MIILLVLGFGTYYGHTNGITYWGMGMSVVQFVLLALLGWQVFGAPVK